MAQPATGVSFSTSGLNYWDTLRTRRGGDWSVIWRDYDGLNTDISPGSSFGSPMADDGLWRDDLFAVVQDADGKWRYNLDDNQGFYPAGMILPDGIERSPKIDSDPLEFLQSIDPARIDMQKRNKTVMFTPMENNPFVHAVQYNLPLTGTLERADASGTYFAGEPDDPDFIRRQVIILHEDRQGGKVERRAFPIPKCVLTDVGSMKGNKKDADAPKFTLSREIDNYFVDSDGRPILDGLWVAGDLWDEDGRPGLSLQRPAPVAVKAGSTTATITLTEAIGGTPTYTYTVEKSASSSMTSPSSATVGSTSLSGTTRTLNITGLTTATTYYFQVTVTDTASKTHVSKVSNAITTD